MKCPPLHRSNEFLARQVEAFMLANFYAIAPVPQVLSLYSGQVGTTDTALW
jgi:hypothetical protein